MYLGYPLPLGPSTITTHAGRLPYYRPFLWRPTGLDFYLPARSGFCRLPFPGCGLLPGFGRILLPTIIGRYHCVAPVSVLRFLPPDFGLPTADTPRCFSRTVYTPSPLCDEPFTCCSYAVCLIVGTGTQAHLRFAALRRHGLPSFHLPRRRLRFLPTALLDLFV